MKKFRTILGAMLVIASIAMVSCKDNKKEVITETNAENQGKEYTSAYVCPMHCEDSGSDKEGKCGTCGMTLVKNEDHKSNGHKHE
ncbi:hypothetical protein HZY62_06205 [Maribacter polysiphoniae]|uniref:Heavy metal binding domain-containing protein n=1 Tax=Maribacter polysiphoniae TaxID=429344 RepID=A0A316E8C6_9FLAO|nr:heavy metal-binding domain-containing protein [Maribacter polysiphoniae]MBD1260170.1 hypothetical protein [Maribacter polysiphoniae]PWK25629.1 hypothetical protein LX92_00371 [Maribacter polysiphoniae]